MTHAPRRSSPRSGRRADALLLLASLTLLPTCTDALLEPDLTPTFLQLLGGSPQQGVVAQPLAEPLVVRVVHADGAEVSGVPVTWSATAGTLDADTTVTDRTGEARVQWTLGPTAGEQRVEATVDGVGTIELAALALPDRPAIITVSPDTVRFEALGASASLAADVTDQFGNTIDDAAFEWLSSAPEVADVDEDGVITGHAPGAALVTVTADTAQAIVSVLVAQTPSALVLEPDSARLTALEDTLRISARVQDANGFEVAGLAVAWESLAPAIAEVDTTGLATARAKGIASIRATTGELEAITVLDVHQEPDRVAITPASATLDAPGDTVRLLATIYDRNDHEIADEPVEWSSDDPSIASVDEAGLVRAEAPGTTTVTATAGSASAAATITVGVGVGVALEEVSGNAQQGERGSALAEPLVVRALDASGVPTSVGTVRFVVVEGDGTVEPAEATPDEDGLAQTSWTLGFGVGTQRVRAELDGTDAFVTFEATAVATPAGDMSSISADPTSIPADGTSTSTITVHLNDASGQPIPVGGDDVTLSTTHGSLGDVVDNGDGSYTAILTAAATPGSATITGTVNGQAFDDQAQVQMTPVEPVSGTISWINADGGDWSDGTNWSTGAVPTARDTVAITLDGTYTVTLDIDAAIAALTLGGSSGAQTLSATDRTLTVEVSATIGPAGELSLVRSSLAGPASTVTNAGLILLTGSTIQGALVNEARLEARRSSALDGPVTTTSTSVWLLEGVVQTVDDTDLTVLTVAEGFTNEGLIELTIESPLAQNVTLAVATGTLVNAAAATIRTVGGFGGGSRVLAAELDNRGTIDVTGEPFHALAPLRIDAASATHTNSGLIRLDRGNLNLHQTGSGPSFTSTGIIDIGFRFFNVDGGTFTNAAGGTLQGSGTLNVSGATFANAGVVSPGTPSGIFRITGAYPNEASALLRIDLGGTTAGTEYDRVAVTGAATLAGQLEVTLINGFAPTAGDQFDVLTAETRDGAFAVETLPALAGSLAWHVDYLETGVRLRVEESTPPLTDFWVAVGEGEVTIATSPDGVTWTGRASPLTESARHVAWNGALWVAVGTGDATVATSTDGIEWTARAAPLTVAGQAVAWNGEQWVAGGRGDASIATSSDGITWTPRASPFTDRVRGVAWNGSHWVAVGAGDATIATSPDGITWTARQSPFVESGHGVAWNGALWVAAGEGGATIATSPDGITWTAQTSPITTRARAVAWNGSFWVAVGTGTASVATSSDGVDWTPRSAPLDEVGRGVAWNGSHWLVAGRGGTETIMTSANGVSWVAQGAPFNPVAWSAAWTTPLYPLPVNQAPTATISAPDDGASFTAGEPIEFHGSASDPEQGALTGASLVWASDVDGELGTGESITRADLTAGTHTITLTATDDAGAQSVAAMTITITAAPARGVQWINASGGNWSDGANWSTGTVPIASDTVLIALDGTYTVTLDVDATVAVLEVGGASGAQTLRIDGSTLTLEGAADVRAATGRLELISGLVNGPDTLTIAGELLWVGGDMDGGGATRVPQGGVATLSGSPDKFLVTRTFEVGGVAEWLGGTLNVIRGSAFRVLEGGHWHIETDGELRVMGSPGLDVVENAGSIAVSAGTEVFIDAFFANTGTIHVSSGLFGFLESSHHGAVQVDEGARLGFIGAFHGLGPNGSFVGAGGVFLDGGTLAAGNGYALTGRLENSGTLIVPDGQTLVTPDFLLNNGVVTGQGTLGLTGTFDWSHGQQIGGGTTHVAAGAAGTISGQPGDTEMVIRNRTIAIEGTVTVTAAELIEVGSNAEIHVLAGGIFDIRTDLTIERDGAATLSNAGTLVRSLGSGTATIEAAFSNSGTLDVGTGTLRFADVFAHHDGAVLQGSGAADLSAATVTAFDGDVRPGTSPGVFTILGDYAPGSASTLHIELGGTVAGAEFDRLAVSGEAALDGTLDVTLIDGFTPTAGAVFDVLTSGARSGTFAAENLPALPAGLAWEVDYLDNAVRLRVVATEADTTTVSWINPSGDWGDPDPRISETVHLPHRPRGLRRVGGG